MYIVKKSLYNEINELTRCNNYIMSFFCKILDLEISNITQKTRIFRNVRVPLTICRAVVFTHFFLILKT